MWAFNWSEYSQLRGTEIGGGKPTSIVWALIDSFNYCMALPLSLLFSRLEQEKHSRTSLPFFLSSRKTGDFLKEGGRGIKFLFDYARNKPGTRSGTTRKEKRARKRLRVGGEKLEGEEREEGDTLNEKERDGDLYHNGVGLDFERAFARVREESDDEQDVDDGRIGGREGNYAGIGAKSFAERNGGSETIPTTTTSQQQYPHYHPSTMSQTAFPPSAPPFDSYRPLPYDNLSRSPHPYASNAPLDRVDQRPPTREDWRPYTPPNVDNGIVYRPVR